MPLSRLTHTLPLACAAATSGLEAPPLTAVLLFRGAVVSEAEAALELDAGAGAAAELAGLLGAALELVPDVLLVSSAALFFLREFRVPASEVALPALSAVVAELSAVFLRLFDFDPASAGAFSPAAASEPFVIFLLFFLLVSAGGEVSGAVVPEAVPAFLPFFDFLPDLEEDSPAVV